MKSWVRRLVRVARTGLASGRGGANAQEVLGHLADQEHLALHQFPEDHEAPGKVSQKKLEPIAKYVPRRKQKPQTS